HDLMALVCVHYEHVNLAPLWTLIEAALLSPERSEQTMSAHGLSWHQDTGNAIAQSPGQWLADHADPANAEQAHALAGIVFELRQYAALLAAHRIPLAFANADHDADNAFVTDLLCDPDPALGTARLYAHEAPGLGVVALSVAQAQPGQPRVLANAWPLSPRVDAACRQLADRFDCAAEPERLGRVLLDDRAQLTVPAVTAH